MRFLVRWLRRGLFALLALVVVAAGAIWLWAERTVPPLGEAYALPHLDAPVQLLVDPHGIPHIFAATDLDAYRTLGWLHARDRFAQMDTLRRLGQGRLAEILGPSALRSDRLTRTLGLYRRAEASVGEMSQPVRVVLEAYAQGVNAWLASPDRRLPPEYVLLPEPEPWVPADSVVWGQLMALQLSGNYRHELNVAALEARLGADMADWLLPAGIGQAPATIPADPGDASGAGSTDAGSGEPGGRTFQSVIEIIEMELPGLEVPPRGDGDDNGPGEPAEEAPDDIEGRSSEAAEDWTAALDPTFARTLLGLLPDTGPSTASNAWVVHGSRTETGAPILANDPHLGLSAPVLWYLVRIETPHLMLAGASVPGVPYLVLGHNGAVAWGMTTTNADTQDLFVERLDPADPDRYLTSAGYVRMEIREEIIEVSGAEPVTLTIRETRNGPVFSDIGLPETAGLADDTALSLAWTALGDVDSSAEALHLMNRATDWESFRAALRWWMAPVQNVFYADVEGHIGVFMPGALPVRGEGATAGRLWDGSRDEALWTDIVPFEELPQALDPERGFLANANNAIVGPDFPHFVSDRYDEPYRALRLEELLEEAESYSLDDAVAHQLDIVSMGARRLLPLMTRITAAGPESARALALLRAWDGSMDRDRPEPLIYSVWLRELFQALYEDVLGPSTLGFGAENVTLIARTLEERPELCDDERTEVVETCDRVLASSLARALDRLHGRYGGDPESWRWGAAHRAPLQHTVYGRVPVLRELLSIEIETDGGFDTLNRGAGPYAPASVTFRHTLGAGLRAVYDLADLGRSRFILATGQSGNPWSRNFGDQTETWRDGGWIELSGAPDQLMQRAGWVAVTLRPAR